MIVEKKDMQPKLMDKRLSRKDVHDLFTAFGGVEIN